MIYEVIAMTDKEIAVELARQEQRLKSQAHCIYETGHAILTPIFGAFLDFLL